MNREIRHAISAGLLATALLALPLMVPLFMPLMPLAPLPLYLVGIRFGVRAVWLSSVVMLLYGLMTTGLISVALLQTLIIVGFPALTAWLIRRQWSLGYCILAAVFIALAVLLAGLLISWVVDFDPVVHVAERIRQVTDALMASLEPGAIDAVQRAQLSRAMDQFADFFAPLFPGLFLSGWLVLQLINLQLSRHILIKMGEKRFILDDPVWFRVPDLFVWALVVGLALSLAVDGFLRFAAINLCLLLAVPYFFQGLAVLQTLFNLYRIAPFFRTLFYVMLFLWLELAILVALVGLGGACLGTRV
ncbi:MAG: DUF2232 domain-containing protein, partial [Magnetococcales bacterium]|nr:DUF2232 domain-containing protein [Magnetococcales bacterium]